MIATLKYLCEGEGEGKKWMRVFAWVRRGVCWWSSFYCCCKVCVRVERGKG